MNYKHLRDIRWLRSSPTVLSIDTSGIDAEQGILKDVVMVEEGPAKGHGVHLESEFIEAITAYDQKRYAKNGLKARFGHPSASGETMGTQLGVFSNFRTREVKGKMQEIADLQLLDSAEKSPTHPGMKSWVLSMAEERPDFIMSSIVFRGSDYYQRDDEGEKVIMQEVYDEWEGYTWENYDEDKPVFVEFNAKKGAEHYYTDLVESGAATENLFSSQANPDFFVSQAHTFLDDHPALLQFVKQNPDKVHGFLQRLGISISQPQQKKMTKTFSIIKWLTGEPQDAEPNTEDLDQLKLNLTAAKTAMTTLQAEKAALDNRVKELTAQVDTLQTSLEAQTAEAETLRTSLAARDAEIVALKQESAAEHTAGDVDTSLKSVSNTPVWDKFKEQYGL
jgi:hypothetical protein